MTLRSRIPIVAFVAMMLAPLVWTNASRAQVDYTFVPSDGNWHVNENWRGNVNGTNFVPDGTLNPAERAIVDRGRLAFVDNVITDASPGPGTITLGSSAGPGTLEIRNQGTLNAVTGMGVAGNVVVGAGGRGTLRILPGGTMTTAGPLTTGNAANSFITVGSAAAGAANLTVNSATLNGTTQVFPNAVFNVTNNLSLGTGGSYSTAISSTNANGAGRVSVGGTANLNGRLRLNFSGITPAVGNSWTLFDAADFGGSFFKNIDVTAPGLPIGRGFAFTDVDAGGRREYRAAVEQVLILEVNRDTGAANIKNQAGAPIALDSYFIGSDAGLLNAGVWNSFKDAGILGGNWVTTAATATNIGELKPTVNASAADGFNHALGSIYSPLAGAFGNADDLQFMYSRTTDGALVRGDVRYTGTRANSLVLQVDPTGSADSFLRNTSQTTVEIDSYYVTSGGGSLQPTSGWNSLDDQNFGGADVWLEGLQNSINQISEVNQSGFTSLAPGAILNLGKLFGGGTQDLDFKFLQLGQETATNGVVVYEALTNTCIAGDFNCSGGVENADLTLLLNNWAQAVPPVPAGWTGNPQPTGPAIDNDELTALLNNWGKTAGSGSSQSAGAPVPEPATWLLLVLGAVASFGVCRTGW